LAGLMVNLTFEAYACSRHRHPVRAPFKLERNLVIRSQQKTGESGPPALCPPAFAIHFLIGALGFCRRGFPDQARSRSLDFLAFRRSLRVLLFVFVAQGVLHR